LILRLSSEHQQSTIIDESKSIYVWLAPPGTAQPQCAMPPERFGVCAAM